MALETGIKEITLPSGMVVTAPKLDVLLVRLTDSDGYVGYSFLWASELRQIALFEAVVRYFAGQVVGRRLAEEPPTADLLRRASNFFGFEGLASFGVAAYEMAFTDLTCRRLGVSLGARLGRQRTRVPAYQTTGLLSMSIDELVAEVTATAATGVAGVKIMVGCPDLGQDVERIDAVRSALPGHVSLMADALQHWNYPQALRAAERLAPFDLVWLEEPILYDDLEGYRKLAQRSPVPIAAGEGQYGLASYQRLVDSGIPYLIGDLSRVGGISAWMRIADIAAAGSAVMLPHIYPQVSAQLVSALPAKEVWLENVPWFDDLAGGPFEFSEGCALVPDTPGSGFDPVADAIENHARGPWNTL